LVGLSFVLLVGWSVGRLVGWLVGYVDWLVGNLLRFFSSFSYPFSLAAVLFMAFIFFSISILKQAIFLLEIITSLLYDYFGYLHNFLILYLYSDLISTMAERSVLFFSYL